MYGSSDDSQKILMRKVKVGVMVMLLTAVVFITIGVSSFYDDAFPMITVLCILLAPIPVSMCFETHEELFYSDRSTAKDIIKGFGYMLLLTFMTLAFAVPFILLEKSVIGPDLCAWISVIALFGGLLDAVVVHAIFYGL